MAQLRHIDLVSLTYVKGLRRDNNHATLICDSACAAGLEALS